MFDIKVDKVNGMGLTQENFTTILKEKLENFQLDSHLNDKNAHADLFDTKIDKVNGMALTQENFTSILKEKLENFKLDPGKFQGQFSSLKDLLSTHPDGVTVENSEGWTAFVMIDSTLVLFIWDFVSSIWIATNKNHSTETPASIKEKYESNVNTNVFDDDAKNKLAGVINTVIATDVETQINSRVPEDEKVISRLKLFNWWEWLKSLPLKWNNTITTLAGTTTTPPLIIPNGTLTTSPQNGAIERDYTGNLHHIVSFSRERLLDTRDLSNFLQTTYRTYGVTNIFLPYSNVNSMATKSISLPVSALGTYNSAIYLFKTFDIYTLQNNLSSGTIPESVLFEVCIKGLNCKFNGKDSFRIYSTNRTDMSTRGSIRNYEIPLAISDASSNLKSFSVIKFSELEFDNLGNIISEKPMSLNLQTQGFPDSNSVGDMRLSTARIELEFRISGIFQDQNNTNGSNANFNSFFQNFSSLFLKL